KRYGCPSSAYHSGNARGKRRKPERRPNTPVRGACPARRGRPLCNPRRKHCPERELRASFPKESARSLGDRALRADWAWPLRILAGALSRTVTSHDGVGKKTGIRP